VGIDPGGACRHMDRSGCSRFSVGPLPTVEVNTEDQPNVKDRLPSTSLLSYCVQEFVVSSLQSILDCNIVLAAYPCASVFQQYQHTTVT
jgi:hypothetical protein